MSLLEVHGGTCQACGREHWYPANDGDPVRVGCICGARITYYRDGVAHSQGALPALVVREEEQA